MREDPYVAAGVRRMFPNTLSGRSNIARPVDPIRRQRKRPKIASPCPVLLFHGSALATGMTGANDIAFDGQQLWYVSGGNPGFDWDVTTVALNAPGTAVDSFTISEHLWPDTYGGNPVIGADAAGDFLYIGIDHETGAPGFGGYVAYLTMKKRSSGGTITSIGEVFAADLLGSTLGTSKAAFYDPANDRIVYLLAASAGSTSVALKAVNMSGTVTTLASLTLADPPNTAPFVGASGNYWWLEDVPSADNTIAHWSSGAGYGHVSGVTVDDNTSFGFDAMYPNGDVLVALRLTAGVAYRELIHPDLSHEASACLSDTFSTGEKYIGAAPAYAFSIMVLGSDIYIATPT